VIVDRLVLDELRADHARGAALLSKHRRLAQAAGGMLDDDAGRDVGWPARG
jgi:hypothetical protein